MSKLQKTGVRRRAIVGSIYGVAVAALFVVALARLDEKQSIAKVDPPAPVLRVSTVAVPPDRVASKRARNAAVFAAEENLTPGELLKRWSPEIVQAAKRFNVPAAWIRAVMQVESGGRTMLNESTPITSQAGAVGLMQLMPATYEEMRRSYALGPNRFDPHDNILAGAAYLAWLREKYGYPALFAAYNDGPGYLDERLVHAQLLPLETRSYLVNVTAAIANRHAANGGGVVQLTRPNGSTVFIDAGQVLSVRSALPDEYPPCVQAVIAFGKLRQGVCETVGDAKAIIRAHGDAV